MENLNILEKLGKGIKTRDLFKEGSKLVEKWERTGLLEGLKSDKRRHDMARLLENQTKQLLKESSLMARSGGGDAEGYAAVAFPIVRRVFGELIANDLVAIQPMSLPAGLIFFLDFRSDLDSNAARLYANVNESLFGQGRLASQITGGALLTGTYAEEGFYHLNQGYSSPTGSATIGTTTILSGTYGGQVNGSTGGAFSHELMKLVNFDPEFVSGTTNVSVVRIPVTSLNNSSTGVYYNNKNLMALVVSSSAGHQKWAATDDVHVRRLTKFSGSAQDHILLFNVSFTGVRTPVQLSGAQGPSAVLTFPIKDNITTGNSVGSVVGADQWGLEADAGIPEINIKIDSASITTVIKKLKAKWSPELGQDLAAFHNLDAEQELTQIMSEYISLEIDREIIVDLIKGATGGIYYWSRSPGMFLNKLTGEEIGANTKAPDFTGNVSEWYETLFHTVQDLSAQIHRKVLKGGANFIVTSPEVAAIMAQTRGFAADIAVDEDKGSAGTVKVGSVNRKWDVYVDPYFPRNLLLVGRKGSTFLESGYTYAPYIPLQFTPTIFGTEDFVPRKGCLTRYGKFMQRGDYYSLLWVRGLLGESGS